MSDSQALEKVNLIVFDPISESLNTFVQELQDKSMVELERSEDPDEIIQLAKQFVPCMLFASLQNADSLMILQYLFDDLKLEMENDKIKAIVSTDNKALNLLPEIEKYKVSDIVIDPVQSRTMMFKAKLHIKALQSSSTNTALNSVGVESLEKTKDDSDQLMKVVSCMTDDASDDSNDRTKVVSCMSDSDINALSADSGSTKVVSCMVMKDEDGNDVSDGKTITEVEALDSGNDTFKFHSHFKKGKQHNLELEGPYPQEGSWRRSKSLEEEDGQNKWQFVPNDVDEAEVAKGNIDGWVFNGKKPSFNKKKKKWEMQSESPDLSYYRKKKKAESKISTDADGNILVAGEKKPNAYKQKNSEEESYDDFNDLVNSGGESKPKFKNKLTNEFNAIEEQKNKKFENELNKASYNDKRVGNTKEQEFDELNESEENKSGEEKQVKKNKESEAAVGAKKKKTEDDSFDFNNQIKQDSSEHDDNMDLSQSKTEDKIESELNRKLTPEESEETNKQNDFDTDLRSIKKQDKRKKVEIEEDLYKKSEKDSEVEEGSKKLELAKKQKKRGNNKLELSEEEKDKANKTSARDLEISDLAKKLQEGEKELDSKSTELPKKKKQKKQKKVIEEEIAAKKKKRKKELNEADFSNKIDESNMDVQEEKAKTTKDENEEEQDKKGLSLSDLVDVNKKKQSELEIENHQKRNTGTISAKDSDQSIDPVEWDAKKSKKRSSTKEADDLEEIEYYYVSVEELGEENGGWHHAEEYYVYLSAVAYYRGFDRIFDLLPVWIYQGEFIPEYQEKNKRWRTRDREAKKVFDESDLPFAVVDFLNEINRKKQEEKNIDKTIDLNDGSAKESTINNRIANEDADEKAKKDSDEGKKKEKGTKAKNKILEMQESIVGLDPEKSELAKNLLLAIGGGMDADSKIAKEFISEKFLQDKSKKATQDLKSFEKFLRDGEIDESAQIEETELTVDSSDREEEESEAEIQRKRKLRANLSLTLIMSDAIFDCKQMDYYARDIVSVLSSLISESSILLVEGADLERGKILRCNDNFWEDGSNLSIKQFLKRKSKDSLAIPIFTDTVQGNKVMGFLKKIINKRGFVGHILIRTHDGSEIAGFEKTILEQSAKIIGFYWGRSKLNPYQEKEEKNAA